LKILLAHGGNPNLLSRPAPPFTTYDVSPLYDAVRGRNPENARILIKAGADLNVRNSAGWTPLMEAAIHRSYEVMYVLLEAGADFRLTDSFGYSVTYYLLDVKLDPKSDVFKARQKCMKFLEAKGVDFEKEKLKNAEIDRQNEERRKRSPTGSALDP
jgi:ankyrin repeat protein